LTHSSSNSSSKLITVASAAAFLCGVACTGVIGGASTQGTSSGPGSGSAGNGSPPADGSSGAGGPAPVASGAGGGPASVLSFPSGTTPTARLRRLTTPELTYSLQDLLGSNAPVSAVDPDVAVGVFGPVSVSVGGFATIGASTVAVSSSGVGLYEAAIGGATTYAFSDPTQAAAILACVPQTPTDTACFTQAINALGRRAFRRPLTSSETTRFLNLATTIAGQPGSSVLAGLRYAASAILQSPGFLYRVELGVPSAADGGRLKYTSYEIASRLAATLWSSVPDDALLDAAATDALSTPDGIATQAQRLLADARVHRSLSAFVDQVFDAQGLSQVSKDPTLFPAWTDTLRAAMQRELELRVDDVVFTQKSDFFSLFESRSTFVNNELAKFYDLPQTATDSVHQATFPADSPRVGLLGAGAILAAQAMPDRTSPVLRGLFVDEMLLCKLVPPPPPGVPPLPAQSSTNQTVRQQMVAHRAQPQCAACHGLMDPIGFGMENFDATGQYRTTDKAQPIDATGTLDGLDFANLAELGTAVRKNPAMAPCLVANMYVNALGRSVTGLDAAAIDSLTKQFATAGNRVDQLLVSLVSNDSFRFVAPK
jgi:hypothetical protein